MKKLFCLLAGVLLFASCTEKDENYENFKRVEKGYNIYYWTSVQQSVATVPVDMTMRLAIMLAEAERQQIDITDVTALREMDYKEMNLWDWYFGRGDAMTLKVGEDGYTMTFNPQGVSSYGCRGELKVQTGGVAHLADTDAANAWQISLSPDFRILVATVGAPVGYATLPVSGGDYTLFREADAYAVSLRHFSARFDEEVEGAPFWSDWSGSLTLTPPDKCERLAYSECADKMFGCSGQASGSTIFSLDGKEPTRVEYTLKDGVFADALSIYRGEEHCVMNTLSTYYPVREVDVYWDYAQGGRRSRLIRYNGHSWQTKF